MEVNKMKKLLSLLSALLIFTSVLILTPARATEKIKLNLKNTSVGIKLSWNKNSSDNYTVYRKTDKTDYIAIKTVTGKNSYTDNTVESGNLYSYKLTSGSNYEEKTIKFLKTPKNLIIEADEAGQVYAQFSQVKGAEKYELYQAKLKHNKTGKYKKIKTIKAYAYLSDTEYSEEFFVLPKQAYKYKVRAISGKYKSAFSKAKKFTNNANLRVSVKMTKNYKGVLIRWQHIGATKYFVYKAVGKKKNFKKIAAVKKVNVRDYSSYYSADCKYTDKKVKVGTKYYYYVVAKSGKKLIRQKNKTSKIVFNKYDKVKKLKIGESFNENDYSSCKIVSGNSSVIKITDKEEWDSDFIDYKIEAVKKGEVIVSFYGWFEYNEYWRRYKIIVE